MQPSMARVDASGSFVSIAIVQDLRIEQMRGHRRFAAVKAVTEALFGERDVRGCLACVGAFQHHQALAFWVGADDGGIGERFQSAFTQYN